MTTARKRSRIEFGQTKSQKVISGVIIPSFLFLIACRFFYDTLINSSHWWGTFAFIALTMFGGILIAVTFHYGLPMKDSTSNYTTDRKLSE